MRRTVAVPITMTVVGLVLLTATVVSFQHDSSGPQTAASAAAAVPADPSDSLAVAIAKAQVHLRVYPKDDETWAELGSAYVQQARVTGDPTYYPKAEGALDTSLRLNSTDNWQGMVGMGALANARHEFAQALVWGHKAQAINDYNSSIYGVLDDALTQLGDYPSATAVMQKMLDLEPGIPSFTRASYEFEEHGDLAGARASLVRAMGEATDPADIAFCRYYLGELSFNHGDPKTTLAQDELGLKVDPSYDPLLAGKAKAEAALGQTTAALSDYTLVISRVPQPQYVLEDGELLQSLGRQADANTQYQLLAVEDRLLAANGVVDDLTASVVAADHGSAAAAVSHAQAEWGRRKSVLVADALAWALHRDGKNAQALRYSKQADKLGWQNATFAYHRGMIELSLGDKAQARTQLTRALKINPYFSLLQAPVARKALASLGGPE